MSASKIQNLHVYFVFTYDKDYMYHIQKFFKKLESQ